MFGNLKSYVDWQIAQKITGAISEGNCYGVPEQVLRLGQICISLKPNSILEIGFNAGHSANLFLGSCNGEMISVDLAEHEYVVKCKAGIDSIYPGRHTLIVGDSLNALPSLQKSLSPTFDLIYVDGGHSYEIAKHDLINSKKLSHAKTLVIMDDTYRKPSGIRDWNEGPNRAWKEAIESKFVTELETWDFEQPGRGMSCGFFNF